jgi:hypothetical protein
LTKKKAADSTEDAAKEAISKEAAKKAPAAIPAKKSKH